MHAREEARLTTLLWEAAKGSEGPLSQREIDAILQVQPHVSLGQVPRQRHVLDTGSPSRVWTDTGDQSWLDDLVERHRREQLTLNPLQPSDRPAGFGQAAADRPVTCRRLGNRRTQETVEDISGSLTTERE